MFWISLETVLKCLFCTDNSNIYTAMKTEVFHQGKHDCVTLETEKEACYTKLVTGRLTDGQTYDKEEVLMCQSLRR